MIAPLCEIVPGESASAIYESPSCRPCWLAQKQLGWVTVTAYSGESYMLNRRILLSLVASIGIALAGGAIAKNQHHNNGHNLLGAKLNQNGKHEIGKAGNAAVTAEVNNKKVVNMSAGSLPTRKVKSKKKMAGLEPGSRNIEVAANGEIQLAQAVEVYYYGYCFDTGMDEYCYWYPAADVIVTDTWIEYTPL